MNTDFLGQLVSDPELCQLYFAGLADPDALQTEERLRFEMVMVQVFRTLESQHLEHHEGDLAGDFFESYLRSFAPLLAQPGGATSWRRLRS